MRKVFGGLSAACALAAFVFCIAAADARAQAGEKRRDGPIPGPVIKLPPGQYDTPLAPAEDDDAARQQKPAASARDERRAAQRWEYCSIQRLDWQQKDSFSSTFVVVAHVRYYRGGGWQVEGRDPEEALANALNRLGEEGWELVAVREFVNLSDGTGASSHSYFFKRPL